MNKKEQEHIMNYEILRIELKNHSNYYEKIIIVNDWIISEYYIINDSDSIYNNLNIMNTLFNCKQHRIITNYRIIDNLIVVTVKDYNF